MSLDMVDTLFILAVILIVAGGFYILGYNIGYMKGGDWVVRRLKLEVDRKVRSIPSVDPYGASTQLCRHKIPINVCVRCSQLKD